MNKDEAIKQLQSLRERISDYARGNDDPIFSKDIKHTPFVGGRK